MVYFPPPPPPPPEKKSSGVLKMYGDWLEFGHVCELHMVDLQITWPMFNQSPYILGRLTNTILFSKAMVTFTKSF